MFPVRTFRWMEVHGWLNTLAQALFGISRNSLGSGFVFYQGIVISGQMGRDIFLPAREYERRVFPEETPRMRNAGQHWLPMFGKCVPRPRA